MSPLMKARMAVPSTGRHRLASVPLNTGAEYSSEMGARRSRERLAHTTDTKNSAAPNGSMNGVGARVTRKYTTRLSMLLIRTNTYTLRRPKVPEKRAHMRLINASPAPKHTPPNTRYGTKLPRGTNPANWKAMRVTTNPTAAVAAVTTKAAIDANLPVRRASTTMVPYTAKRATMTAMRNTDCTRCPASPNEVSTVGDSNDM